jgi:long-chain acyl-CoA synthetase
MPRVDEAVAPPAAQPYKDRAVNTTAQPSLSTQPWLASYPPGVPAQVEWRERPTLRALLEHSCERFADKPAFTSMGVTMSYARLNTLSRDFAAWLQHGAGLGKGDRVAVMLPNTLQHPVTVLGSLRAGMAVVNINPMYTPAELRHQLIDSGARVLVVLENFAHTAELALPGTVVEQVVVTRFGDLFPAAKGWLVNFALKHIKHAVPDWSMPTATSLPHALDEGATQTLRDVALDADDMAFLQYTGGTTGLPKGAMLTHGNLVANLEQVVAWTRNLLKEGEETVITALPLARM